MAFSILVEANRPNIRTHSRSLKRFQRKRQLLPRRCHAQHTTSSTQEAVATPAVESIPTGVNLVQSHSHTKAISVSASLGVEPAAVTTKTKTKTSKPTSTGGSGSGTAANNLNNPSGGTGDMTFYDTGLGACGWTNKDTDMIAAAAFELFDHYEGGYPDGNPNHAPICGKKISLTIPGASKSITLTIVDRCAGCTIPGSMDLSPTAFSQLADQTVGRVHGMTWKFID